MTFFTRPEEMSKENKFMAFQWHFFPFCLQRDFASLVPSFPLKPNREREKKRSDQKNVVKENERVFNSKFLPSLQPFRLQKACLQVLPWG